MIRISVIGRLGQDAQVNNVNGKSVINFSSFGGYFLQSLYGSKSQIVTWKDLKNIDSVFH